MYDPQVLVRCSCPVALRSVVTLYRQHDHCHTAIPTPLSVDMTETQRRVSLQWRIAGISGTCGLVGAVPAGDSCKRKHPCAYCGKLFLRRSHAKQHQRRHTGDQPYACQICNKKFVHKSHYTYHVTRSLEHHTKLKSLSLSGLGGDADPLQQNPQQHQHQAAATSPSVIDWREDAGLGGRGAPDRKVLREAEGGLYSAWEERGRGALDKEGSAGVGGRE